MTTIETRFVAGGRLNIDAVPAVVTVSGPIDLRLTPREARSLSRALLTASKRAERNHGDEPVAPQSIAPADLVLCDRCVDMTHPHRGCPDCAAETAAELAAREEVTA